MLVWVQQVGVLRFLTIDLFWKAESGLTWISSRWRHVALDWGGRGGAAAVGAEDAAEAADGPQPTEA